MKCLPAQREKISVVIDENVLPMNVLQDHCHKVEREWTGETLNRNENVL